MSKLQATLQLQSLQLFLRTAPNKLLLTKATHGNNAFSPDWLDDLVDFLFLQPLSHSHFDKQPRNVYIYL
jgi:hypothetical protein